MKSTKLLCTLALLAAASAASAAVPANAPPALYSFEDVYRLAIAGPAAAPTYTPAADEAAIRVAASVQAPVAVEPSFVVEPLAGPRGWLLLLAGLAAAGWVAHRRLAQL